MKESTKISWKDAMAFEADFEGHKIPLDTLEEFGGRNQGVRPKPLMLIALAGCTAMDVVSILNKMRIAFDDFNVEVEGELTEEHPKHYHKMHILYTFKGKDLPMEKLEKAVSLSQERYCGVSYTLAKAVTITHEIRIEG